MRIIVVVSLLAAAAAAQAPARISARTRGLIRVWIQQKAERPALDVANMIDASILFDDLSVALEDELRNADRDRRRRAFLRQLGESAAGGGATSLVARTGAPDLFAAAMENGALARQREGTVTTFRFNAYGVARLFEGHGKGDCVVIDPFCDGPQGLLLRGLTGSVSLDNSAPDRPVTLATQPALATALTALGQGGRIESAGVRYALFQRRTPTTKPEIEAWSKAVRIGQPAGDLADALAKLGDKLREKSTGQVEQFKRAVTEEFATSGRDLEERIARRYQRIFEAFRASLGPAAAADPEIAAYMKSLKAYDDAMTANLRNLYLKPALTVEYHHLQPSSQTPTSNFRLILDKTFLSTLRGEDRAATPQAALTFNFAATMYERIPVGLRPGRLRDIQTGLQFDRQLGPLGWDNRPTLSVTGYYQYMKENAILEFDNRAQTPIVGLPIAAPAVEVLNTKGAIGIVQAKVEIPVGRTGVMIPLSLSWSNRTELIKEKAVRGQFGITFNLDKLFEQ